MKTLKEIKKAIAESKHSEFFNELNVIFELPHENLKEPLQGLLSTYEFMERQLNGWNSFEQEIPAYLNESKLFFENNISLIEEIVSGSSDYNLNENIETLRNNISDLSDIENDEVSYYIFTADSSETAFLISLNENYPDAVKSAVLFLAKETIEFPSTIEKERFIGYLKAYEFRLPDDIRSKRSEAEKISLSKIRSEYNTYIGDAKIEIKDQFESSQLKRDREFRNWFAELRASFKKFDDNSIQSVKDLEELYNEKLKLEAPAKYWKDRSAKLRKEGDRWLYWLIGVTIVAVLALGTVLYFISDGTLKDLFDKTGSAIRWSIVFVTFVSFLAYGIRTFAKLMFSAYHLHRDAEEREQLSYVYLALKKEQSIDETERHLIMQSLFSRADSGLLKDDSSPTMPGGSIVEKMFGGK